jgi:Sigma-70, region 4
LRLTLERLLRRLDPRGRTIFLLFEVEGFSHREIAGIMDIPEGTSKALLFEVKRKLQGWIMEDIPARAEERSDMSFHCQDLERVLRNGDCELPEELLTHAAACPSCQGKLQSWKELSAAARSLSRAWDSPSLWPRIRRALDEASRHDSRARSRGRSWNPGWVRSFSWQPAIAGLVLLALCLWGTWSFLSRYPPENSDAQRLLTQRALREIEQSEQVYVQSIDKLSRLVPSREQHAESPLLASYREKLLLIDAAIAECRSELELNRFNTHLRAELLSMYQEKQMTLQEMLKEERHVPN